MKIVAVYRVLIMMCLLWETAGMVACKDDDHTKTEIEGPEDNSVELPVEDQMRFTTEVPVTILGSGFSQVVESFVARTKNTLTKITPETRVILFKGEDVYNFDSETFKQMEEAYDRGVILAIDQPKEHHILHLALKLLAPDLETGFSGEEHDEPFVDFLAYNSKYMKEYSLNDIFDDDPIDYEVKVTDENGNVTTDTETIEGGEEQTLTPYMKGLYADEICKWMNRYADGEVATRKVALGGLSRGGEQLLKAQIYSYTYNITFNDEKLKGKSNPYTVTYSIYGVYSYDQDKDYYMVDNEITGSNEGLWLGQGGGYQGYALSELYSDSKLINLDNNKYLKREDGCILMNYSPSGTDNATSVTVESGYDFGGSLGLCGLAGAASISGGASWSTSHTVTLPDVTIEAHSMHDGSGVDTNARWIYKFHLGNPHWTNFWETKWDYGNIPNASKYSFTTHQSWIWQIDKPKQYKKGFQLRTSTCWTYRNLHAWKNFKLYWQFTDYNYGYKLGYKKLDTPKRD